MKNKMTAIALGLVSLTVALLASACATPAAGGLQISDAWARTVNMGAMGGEGSGMETPAAMEGTPSAMETPAAMGEGSGQAMAQQMGAVYMVISNTGAADKLVKAQTDVAETVELHTVIDENGVMQMRPVPAIDVPANGSVELKPGGFHVMLIGVKRDLAPGEKINVTLTFEKAGERQVQADVRSQ